MKQLNVIASVMGGCAVPLEHLHLSGKSTHEWQHFLFQLLSTIIRTIDFNVWLKTVWSQTPEFRSNYTQAPAVMRKIQLAQQQTFPACMYGISLRIQSL